ncbi:hypothetical protein HZS_6864 [Henneguya salminicola]|nr:hypothetical protein HZS_6864 [Henneguya salminicola]
MMEWVNLVYSRQINKKKHLSSYSFVSTKTPREDRQFHPNIIGRFHLLKLFYFITVFEFLFHSRCDSVLLHAPVIESPISTQVFTV